MKFNEELEEYYKYYLSLHKNPKCRLMHFIGQIFTIFFFLFTLYCKKYFLFLFLPFVIYPFAWSGHYFFENNKPAAFNDPIKAKICDWIMFYQILRGKLKIW